MLVLLLACRGDLMVVQKEAPLYEGDEDGECSDNADNDQDGLFDCDDEGCEGSEDCLDEPEDTENQDTASPPDPLDIDNDNDGFSENQGDCDDNNEDIHPDQTEIWYDGIDSNCDELNDYDQDGDGYVSDEYGTLSGLPTGDCDDTDPQVYPEDTNNSENGTDQACTIVNIEGDEDGECSDSADNDQDGLVDCEDDDCNDSEDCQDVDPDSSINEYITTGEHNLTIPLNVNMITVSMWGAGGAGGNQLHATGGGGAFISFTKTVTPGETYTIMVGEGGINFGDGGGASLLFENYGTSNEKLWAVAAGGGGGASDGNSGNSWSEGRGGAGGFQQGQSGSALGVHQNGSVYDYCESATPGTGASQSLPGLGGSYVGTANGCNGSDGSYLHGGSVTSSSGGSFTCNINSSYLPWQSPQSQGNGGGGAGGSGFYGGGSGGFVWTYCGAGGGGGSSYVDAATNNLIYEVGSEQNQGNIAESQGAGKGGDRAYNNVSEQGANGRVVIEW